MSVTFYILLFIAVVIFIFTVGIKLLFGTALFVANLTANKVAPVVSNKTDDLIRNIDVSDIPVATNSPRFVIQGSIVNFDTLIFYINSARVKEKTVPYSENFTEEIGDLEKGTNDVYIVAKSAKENKQKESAHYSVIYLSDKPRLDITEPVNASRTNKQEIKIAGATNKEIFIKINDIPVVVDAKGSFQSYLKLKEGENKIMITASDIAGNIESKLITVTYQKED